MKSGATTQFNECCAQTGLIENMPDIPGVAVFRANGKNTGGKIGMQHVGLYIGGGVVIEARGSREGVIQGALSGYPWTHFGLLTGVAYDGYEPPKPAMSDDALYLAMVVNVKTGLNFRSTPANTTNTMLLLPLGTVIEVLEDNCGNGMCRARHMGKAGYCTRSFLQQIDDEGNGG
jgi:hypothetical protein